MAHYTIRDEDEGITHATAAFFDLGTANDPSALGAPTVCGLYVESHTATRPWNDLSGDDLGICPVCVDIAPAMGQAVTA
jgi:hypothetical protein